MIAGLLNRVQKVQQFPSTRTLSVLGESTCLSRFYTEQDPVRKTRSTLHFLFNNACYTPNNDLNGSEMTDMIKQVSNMIPVNKGWATEWADGGSVYSVDSMCLHSRVCVCRKGAPCDAQCQFGITQYGG